MATVPKTPLPNKNGPSPIVPAMIDDAAKAPIKTHIPVKLAEVKVVFSIASQTEN